MNTVISQLLYTYVSVIKFRHNFYSFSGFGSGYLREEDLEELLDESFEEPFQDSGSNYSPSECDESTSDNGKYLYLKYFLVFIFIVVLQILTILNYMHLSVKEKL